ncbi:MAG: hypothetical protein AAF468_22485 [Pseudomonadota bacterium]
MRAILNRIGFFNARAKNQSLFFGSGFDEKGGLAFASKKQAKEALAKLKKVEPEQTGHI